MVKTHRLQRNTIRAVLCLLVFAVPAFVQPATQPRREPILAYIKKTWAVLTRSNHTLAAAAVDPKFQPGADGRWTVYVSRNENLGRIEQQLRKELAPVDFNKIRLRPLPHDTSKLSEQGLLY